MAISVELFHLEVEELMSAIQRHVNEACLAESGPVGGVRFFPESSADRFGDSFPEDPSNADFSEEDYLYLNPDVRLGIERGEFRSGFAHWLAFGKHEGRAFPPTRFDESEYLELNPDVASGVRDKEYLSGREHWERIGRLEGRKLRSPMRILLPRLKRLGATLEGQASRLGEMPPTPMTIRGILGRQIILVLRRLLWWYTSSLTSIGRAISEITKQEFDCLSHLDAAIRQDHSTLISMQGSVAAITDPVERLIAKVEEESRARAILTSRLDAVTGELQRLKETMATDAQASAGRFADLDAVLAEVKCEAGQTRSQLTVERRRITRALDMTAGVHTPASRDEMQRFECRAPNEALYSAFEDAFRGPRHEIKKRQSIYLRFISAAEVGAEETPILDLGCGRGEWMELLRDHHFIARGLDRNGAFVAQCQALGLDVEHSDALVYLRSLPDSCLGGITSFQMIEHVPFELVLSMLDEIMRVLKPRGLVILETPNPRNLQVGAHHFHLDPTHFKPLPPDMLRFFLQAKGFSDCQELEIHPAEEIPVLPSGQEWLKDLLYGPRDYAIVAHRP